MNDADKAALKTRVEEALAASVKALGTLPTPKHAPANVTFHMDRAWSLVTPEDTRFLLTDPAVRTLGGGGFAVTVDDGGVTITAGGTPAPVLSPDERKAFVADITSHMIAPAGGTPAPAPAPPPAPPEVK